MSQSRWMGDLLRSITRSLPWPAPLLKGRKTLASPADLEMEQPKLNWPDLGTIVDATDDATEVVSNSADWRDRCAVWEEAVRRCDVTRHKTPLNQAIWRAEDSPTWPLNSTTMGCEPKCASNNHSRQ